MLSDLIEQHSNISFSLYLGTRDNNQPKAGEGSPPWEGSRCWVQHMALDVEVAAMEGEQLQAGALASNEQEISKWQLQTLDLPVTEQTPARNAETNCH